MHFQCLLQDYLLQKDIIYLKLQFVHYKKAKFELMSRCA